MAERLMNIMHRQDVKMSYLLLTSKVISTVLGYPCVRKPDVD